MMRLLDDWLPDPHVSECHATAIAAPADVVAHALWHADLGGPVARALLAARCMPGLLSRSTRDGTQRRLRELRSGTALTLAALLETGFTILDERPGREVVLGLTGRFWTPGGSIQPTSPSTWRAGPPPGTAQAGWTFVIEPRGSADCQLLTETRVRCADVHTLRTFRRYWRVVRPFSGLLRQLMLRRVREAAERAARAQSPIRDGEAPSVREAP